VVSDGTRDEVISDGTRDEDDYIVL
jgi:hypothetical protein